MVKFWIRLLTCIVFAALLAVGFWIASQKPLWTDERFSLFGSILGRSYTQILSGILSEGNNSPSFYVLQKLQIDLFRYEPPEAWLNTPDYFLYDWYSQNFLRAQPIILVALSLTLLFYYFAVTDSIVLAIYSLAVALSSFMLWHYWAQARPYALWFALTMVQLIVLLDIFKKPETFRNHKNVLIVVHLILAFTVTLSVAQIVVASFVLWLFVERRWLVYIGLAVVPVGIVLYYSSMGFRIPMFFIDGPLDLIAANIPRDRLFIFGLFGGFCIWDWWKSKRINPTLLFFIFSCLLLLAFGALLARLKWTEMPYVPGVHQVSNRYFMALTPVGIIGVTLFSQSLINANKNIVWKGVLCLGLAVLLYLRILRTLELNFTVQ